MRKAYSKDIWRTVWGEKKRFLSIMMITTLGVTMLCGLRAACSDLRYTADTFYDKQKLYDISVVSTMGLTGEDVKVLTSLDGIEQVEGAYSEVVRTSVGEQNKTAQIKTLSLMGMNVPYLCEGRLPENKVEIAVTSNYLNDSGKKIGDTLVISEELEEDEDASFPNTEYTITGVVIDAMDVDSHDETMSFRSTTAAEYTFFMLPEAVDSDIYTAVYLTLRNGDSLLCYSDAYEELIEDRITFIDTQIKNERQKARHEQITSEAYEELEDAEKEANEEFAKADQEIADAKKELSDGRKELEEGELKLAESNQKLDDSEAEIIEGERKLAQGEEELAQSEEQLNQLETQIAMLEQQEADEATITVMKQQLEAGRQQLEEGRASLAANRAKLTAGRQKIKEGRQQLADAAAEIEANRTTLNEGELELTENEQKLAEEKQKADKEFANAKADIEAIEMPQWYIQERSSLSGYTNVQSDSNCIEAVGTAFPILFLIVAILISLTTITRMIEEERGLIGTYKALGFTDREIRRKYLIYAFFACLIGGILGDLCGFIVIPGIIFWIFDVMYQLPYYLYRFDYLYGIGGILLFAAGIVGASWIACEAELHHTPATLMRPKAPKSGSRIFMERLTPIWKRLSFLNKVTARNLFRYKKRMLMTVGGIMGCTALVLCGFVIKDSVTELLPNQYEYVYRFDAMAATTDSAYEDFQGTLNNMTDVSDYITLRMETVEIKNGKEELSVQLFVIPDGMNIADYICLEDEEGNPLQLIGDGAYITQNAANVLGFTAGDTIQLQDMKLVMRDAEVEALVRNYMGNTVYMSQSAYEGLFGKYKPNGVLLHLGDECEDQIAFTEDLEKIDGVQSTMSVAEMKENFSVSVMIINVVVYIIIIMAAGLALVVLFTLATTNISERERELATIKVLGFFDKEVHLYVNKETLILTGIGIILGLPLGNALGRALTQVLNLPSIYFAVTINPISYAYAAVLSFGFALIVDCLTDRMLNQIDPVEALKSVE